MAGNNTKRSIPDPTPLAGGFEQDDIVIAVMGPTGAGKSSFINTALNTTLAQVGSSLYSCTTRVTPFRCLQPTVNGRHVVLVDTPGFNDTNYSDVQVLRSIADWLKNTYRQRIYVSGLIYLHPIAENRVTSVHRRDLNVFKQLCGKPSLSNVVFMTTMWDEVDEDTGARREEELKRTFLKPMLSAGAKISRFDGTHEAAWDILRMVSDTPHLPTPLLIQVEMVDQNKSLGRTSAGSVLLGFFRKFIEILRRAIRRLQKRQSHTTSPSYPPPSPYDQSHTTSPSYPPPSPYDQSRNSSTSDVQVELDRLSDQLRRYQNEADVLSDDLALPARPPPRISRVAQVIKEQRARSSSDTAAGSDHEVPPSTPVDSIVSERVLRVLDVDADLNLPRKDRPLEGLNMAIGTLQYISGIAALVPFSPVKATIDVILSISKLFRDIAEEHESLSTLLEGVSSLLAVISRMIEQGNTPTDLDILLPPSFLQSLREIEETVQKFRSRGTVKRIILQESDRKVIDTCNSHVSKAYQRLQLVLAIDASRQAELANKRWSDVDYMLVQIICAVIDDVGVKPSFPNTDQPSSNGQKSTSFK